MRIRAVRAFALSLASVFAGCAGSAPTVPTTAHGIECACCFTIVEFVRSNDRPAPGHALQLQCEQCCTTLTFTMSPTGQLLVTPGTAEEAIPCDLCAPAPPR